jgi:cytoskeletal protein CcmA (bactofilin family)
MWGRKEQALEVIIGPESGIKGDLTTKGIVKMDGVLDGNVDADWLIVGETGLVKGDVTSRVVVVYGRIEGTIRSREMADLKSRAIVEGDIYTMKLVVSEGAFFDGRSYMQRFPEGGDGRVVPLEQKAPKSITE